MKTKRLSQVCFIAFAVLVIENVISLLATCRMFILAKGAHSRFFNEAGLQITPTTALHRLWIGYGILFAVLATAFFVTEMIRRHPNTSFITALAGLSFILLFFTPALATIVGLLTHPSAVLHLIQSEWSGSILNMLAIIHGLIAIICPSTILVMCILTLTTNWKRAAKSQ